MSVTATASPRRSVTPPAGVAIATGVTLLVCLPFAPAPLGLVGLALAVAAAGAAGVALWALIPPSIVVLVPALIPSPMVALTFGWEVALAALAAALAVHGLRTRAAWTWRIGDTERWLLAFTAWALFTVFWSPDLRYFLLGARRLILGVVTLWVALRLPHVAGRRWFDMGLIVGATALALSALGHSLTTGLSQAQALLHRTEVTNLGWGTANYVATLLLLFSPSLLRLALRGRRPERALAWAAFALVAIVQLIIASRAATVLFLGGTLAQLLRAALRFRIGVGLGFAATLAAALASPLGYGLLSRLANLRELGSMTIRLWYFREGSRRVVDNLPWGLGLNQGYSNPDRLHGIDPHDYWLLLGGDLGIPGVLLWVAVLLSLVGLVRALHTDEAEREQAYVLALTLVLANLHTLVEPTFQGGQYQLVFFWIMGGTLAYASLRRSPTSAIAPPPPSGVAPVSVPDASER